MHGERLVARRDLGTLRTFRRSFVVEDVRLKPVQKGVPAGPAWLDEVRAYEKNVLAKRDG
jgi:L-rhamnose isomerase